MNDAYYPFQFPPNIPFQIQLVQVTDIPKHWHPAVELILVLRGVVTAVAQGGGQQPARRRPAC